MAVYDLWHKSRPKEDDPTCKEHGLVPSSIHGKGLRWQVRWDVYVNGERKQEKKNFALKVGKDPERHADAFDKVAGSQPASQTVKNDLNLTVRSLGEQWVKSRSIDETSLYTLEVRLRVHVYPGAFGGRLITDLYDDPNLIQTWIKGLQGTGGLAKSTARDVALHLSSMLTYAVHKKIIPSNPMKDNPLVTIPKKVQRMVAPYTTDQLEAITANLKEQYRTLVKVGSGAGLRLGEMLGLSPDDIQDRNILVRRQVRLLTRTNTRVFALPKKGKTRIVPCPDSLREYLLNQPSTPVTYPWRTEEGKLTTVRLFLARDYQGFTIKELTNAWHVAFRRAGIPRVPHEDGFHKLRHTYASRLLKAGVDVRSLAQYLGHDDPGFTLRVYCHFIGTGEDARQAIDG